MGPSTRSACCCARYPSRAALLRATGLRYEALRTWTQGRWRAQHPPPAEVLEAPGAPSTRPSSTPPCPPRWRPGPTTPLTPGKRVVLEALRDFDDRPTAAAPYVSELLRDFEESEGQGQRAYRQYGRRSREAT